MTNYGRHNLMDTGIKDGRSLAVLTGLAALVGVVLVLGQPWITRAEYAGAGLRPTVDPGITVYIPAEGVSGSMVVAGSTTMQPLLLQVATRFRQLYPDVKIFIQAQGTEKGLAQFRSNQAAIRRGDGFYSGQHVSGSVAMLASSRPLTADEIEDFRARNGYEPIEVPIAMGAVALYVHKDNPIQGLTLEQVDAIFGIARKRGYKEDIRTWGQLGLSEGWAEEPIHLYGRDQGSATRTLFKTVALLEGPFRSEVREEPGPASAIISIGRDRLALGYAGIGFQTSAVRLVPLAERAGMPFVTPSHETTANGTYPMWRYLYLYVKREPGRELKPVVMEFLKFVNSREGQEALVRAGGFPLTATQVAKNLTVLKSSAVAAAGTVAGGAN
jgi:phosphate transport system substrate-binding protein